MKLQVLSIVILLIAAVLPAAAQNQSIYTSTRAGACRTILSTDEGSGSYEGECPGVGGYKVRLLEGDIRQTLNVITPAKKKHELNFWEFFSSFSSVGEKLEWRTKAGDPVALIARFNVADPSGVRKGVSYLMVSKIGKSGSCVTDIVKPGARQNDEARKLADSASQRPCRIVD